MTRQNSQIIGHCGNLALTRQMPAYISQHSVMIRNAFWQYTATDWCIYVRCPVKDQAFRNRPWVGDCAVDFPSASIEGNTRPKKHIPTCSPHPEAFLLLLVVFCEQWCPWYLSFCVTFFLILDHPAWVISVVACSAQFSAEQCYSLSAMESHRSWQVYFLCSVRDWRIETVFAYMVSSPHRVS